MLLCNSKNLSYKNRQFFCYKILKFKLIKMRVVFKISVMIKKLFFRLKVVNISNMKIYFKREKNQKIFCKEKLFVYLKNLN